jgi:hypothetical protein
MSWFNRRKKPPLAEASSLGFRSKLVLAKLGFDLRGYYEDLLHDPLPDELRQRLNAVGAQERQSGDLITPSGRRLTVVYQASHETGEPPQSNGPQRGATVNNTGQCRRGFSAPASRP